VLDRNSEILSEGSSPEEPSRLKRIAEAVITAFVNIGANEGLMAPPAVFYDASEQPEVDKQ
jgi:hypothetical protein